MNHAIKLIFEQINQQEGLVRLESRRGQKSCPFQLPWRDDEEWNAVFQYLQAFRQYEETWPKGTVSELAGRQLASPNGIPLANRVEQLGNLLYQVVFEDQALEQFFRQALADDQNETPIVEVHFPSKGSYLQTYPWEILHDGDDFLFDSLRASIVRYVDFDQRLAPLKISNQLNLLLVDPRPKPIQGQDILPTL